jgi:purine-binding chemotaxis protein CheW
MNRGSDFVTLELDEVLYGIPVERVQEILDVCKVSLMPNAPSYMLGVIDLRGENVPIVDLRILMGLDPKADTPQTRFILVQLLNGVSNSVIGLRTDRVIDVTQLDSGELQPLSEGQKLAWDGLSVLGIGRRNGALISVIDLEGLFARRLNIAAHNATRVETEGVA